MAKDIEQLTTLVGNSTRLMFVKSTLTWGFYPIFWGWKNADRINIELNQTTFKSGFFGFLAVLNTLQYCEYGYEFICQYLWFSGVGYIWLQWIRYIKDYGILLFTVIAWSVWSFKMKKDLELYVINGFGVNLRLKGFFTLFFGLYYIVYSINNLKENIEKEKERGFVGVENRMN